MELVGIKILQLNRRNKLGLFENKFNDNIIVEKLDKLLSWSRSTSPWFFQFGTACCAIEMMAAAASRHDLMRIGMIPRSSPRQADVMIVAGTVTMKMALRVKKLYEQMADPKYVVAMGSCATSGGPYWQHGYHVLKGVDIVIPLVAQDPIATTYFGSAICSYNFFTLNAIFIVTVPATIITSACLGEDLGIIPILIKSCLLAAAAIISMAQQAVPNWKNHGEVDLLQLNNLSSFSTIMLSLNLFSKSPNLFLRFNCNIFIPTSSITNSSFYPVKVRFDPYIGKSYTQYR
jgi:NADH-quinone oxidoreductase subunit B